MNHPVIEKKELYYISPLGNLCSILQHGILCHDNADIQFPNRKRIENTRVYEIRKSKGLSKYANLYINPRNPMLFQVYKGLKRKVVVLGVNALVMNKKGVMVSICNAASNIAIICAPDKLIIEELFNDIRNIRYWDDVPNYPVNKYLKSMKNISGVPSSISFSSRNIIMSEVLILDRVPKKYIASVYVPSEKMKSDVIDLVKECEGAQKVEVSVVPDFFFEPEIQTIIYPHLHIVYGDMFFTDAEVLTISVNIVGVMGKGLASRFKYMYPEAYVRYEELCREHQLSVGKPYLLEVARSRNGYGYHKFLLFPTKKHWRENSRIEYISDGLKYLTDRVMRKEWRISSIAMPALGCGLGGLKWKDVGPIMVDVLKRIADIGINVFIYVPENKFEYFQKDFYITN